MATRSNIRVILKEEDRNRDMKFVPNEKQADDLSHEVWGNEHKKVGSWETVNPGGKEALVIYHHWDGYIEGLGHTLFHEYNSYEEALNLVLGGDCSTINGTYTPYAAREGEDWDTIQPTPVDENYPMQEEYDYMFKDDKWYVRGGYDEGCDDWTPLEEYMKEGE
jgi:hypothetical protein